MKWVEKMSKGSIVSVKLPSKQDEIFLKYSKFLRVTSDRLKFLKNYLKAFNENVGEIIEYFIKTVDIKLKFTSRGEILFYERILANLFSKITGRKK